MTPGWTVALEAGAHVGAAEAEAGANAAAMRTQMSTAKWRRCMRMRPPAVSRSGRRRPRTCPTGDRPLKSAYPSSRQGNRGCLLAPVARMSSGAQDADVPAPAARVVSGPAARMVSGARGADVFGALATADVSSRPTPGYIRTMSHSTAPAPNHATPAAPPLACRLCGTPLSRTFVDLGMSPLCESYVAPERLDAMEPFYPLHARICERCLLVQLPALVAPEAIFTEYAYFASYSDSWVEHARQYADDMIARFGMGGDDLVVEP